MKDIIITIILYIYSYKYFDYNLKTGMHIKCINKSIFKIGTNKLKFDSNSIDNEFIH